MTPPADRAARFRDLGPRILSAAVIVAVAVAAVIAGGVVFWLAMVGVVALMMWELHRLCAGGGDGLLPTLTGLAAAAGLLVQGWLPGGMAWLAICPAIALGLVMLRANRAMFAVYGVLVWLAFEVFTGLRGHGAVWFFWMIATVAATDIGGYFGGRLIGGPKLWPAVSPGKTWSGTITGWLGALVVVALFLPAIDVWGHELVLLALGVSVFSQAGDLLESWMKRRVGVKDSSNLIPGHGGVLDRFDGMIGGAVGIALIQAILGFGPGVAG